MSVTFASYSPDGSLNTLNVTCPLASVTSEKLQVSPVSRFVSVASTVASLLLEMQRYQPRLQIGGNIYKEIFHLPSMKMQENVFDIKYEPLAGAYLPNLLRIFAQNKFLFSPRYFPKVAYSFLISSIMYPFCISEKVKYDRKIENTEIKQPPIFLVGHWRSGTTYLHNLFSQDKSMGYFTTFHSTVAGAFITGERFFKPLVEASIPEKRPMDDVPMSADLPQEEEYAMGCLTPYAYYNGWCFPRNMKFYNKFVCMEGMPGEVIEEWKRTYLYLLKKGTFYWKGRRLVLKNPANTGRIKILLDMFPEAKFVHIFRNPYEVYFSMMKFLRIVLPRYTYQRPDEEKIEENMMELYVKMYRKFLKEKEEIPDGNFSEVRYENLIKRPIQELKRVYKELGLKTFEQYNGAFRKYVEKYGHIKTSKYQMDEETKSKIYKKWAFAFDAFGYEP